MRSTLRQPVVERGVNVASLPDDGTVILRNVESLDAREQQVLSTWMESSAARVVTICEAPLYAPVTDGRFSSDLYYRLNILTLVVSSRGAIRPTRDDKRVARPPLVPGRKIGSPLLRSSHNGLR
jgi:hypothetical protein